MSTETTHLDDFDETTRVGAGFGVYFGRQPLGEGGFGRVFLAQDPNGRKCAAKQLNTMTAQKKAQVAHEVKMLELIGRHHAIAELLSFHPGKNECWIFTEFGTGGELFDLLIDSGCLSEETARPIAMELLSALLHCHQRGVVHRDVKLENILLVAEKSGAIKLIDFGLAVQVPRDSEGRWQQLVLSDKAGSRSYKAPEILFNSGYEAPPVDSWSTGIVIFSLLSGFFPFEQALVSADVRFKHFLQAQLSQGMGACDAIYSTYQRVCPFSAMAKELIDGLLKVNYKSRLSIAQAMDHQWLQLSLQQIYEEEPVYRSLGFADMAATGCGGWQEPPPDAHPLERQHAGF